MCKEGKEVEKQAVVPAGALYVGFGLAGSTHRHVERPDRDIGVPYQTADCPPMFDCGCWWMAEEIKIMVVLCLPVCASTVDLRCVSSPELQQ